MVCSWTASYLYQRNTPQEDHCLMDTFCDKIDDYINCESTKSEIITEIDDSWYRYGQPIMLEALKVKCGKEIIAIEELATNIYIEYKSYLEDEASDFGKEPYFIGEPMSEEDIEVFVYDYLKEREM